MERPTRESLILLKKGIKRGKIIKMFGQPDKTDHPADEQKALFGEKLERMAMSKKKEYLSMERIAYFVPGGNIMLVFVFNKLDSWKFFPG